MCSTTSLAIVNLLNQAKFDLAFTNAEAHAKEDGDCTGLLALCYYKGYGIPLSEENTARWSQVAIEKGTTFGSAVGYYLMKKHDLSAPLLLSLLNENISVVQCLLAYQYCHGLGLKEDKKLSISLYMLSADQGYPHAIYNLAFSYESGFGVSMDEKKAFPLYKQATTKGDPYAMNTLGLYYLDGRGGAKKDSKLAVKYFEQSASKGNVRAFWNLSSCYLKGTGVKKDKNKAIAYYKKAADRGDQRSKDKLKELGVES